jgi:uncharacterized protein YigA (DUF484 family)
MALVPCLHTQWLFQLESFLQVLDGHVKEAAALAAMLQEERQERGRIVASLRATIQRVRASGHEEDRLQSEVMHLTGLLSAEKQKCEEVERVSDVTAGDLAEARTKYVELQKLHDELQVASGAAERRHAANLHRVRTTHAEIICCICL